ncbi:hypothetical protein [Prochlorococcus sp. MIT 1341]|uniref:hypothetical protein n=1 Tax=Prochlorococcus sp. MIT 1341 TaxID=3096221 RepID=UPI002A74C7F9|nr:hypothetical protein [Prochlorococcus sp. MIT 1341]
MNISLIQSKSKDLLIHSHSLPQIQTSHQPNEIIQSELSLLHKVDPYYCGDQKYAFQLYPHLTKSLGIGLVCQLASLSEIVGMQVPGKHSLYKSLKIQFGKLNSIYSINVVHSDQRLRLIRLSVNYPSIDATIEAYFRPLPVFISSCNELARKYSHKDYREIRAFIVGGSRGLGAAVAKLIALGGGSSLITFNSGKKDAKQIQADINTYGATCKIMQLDVLKNSINSLDLSPFNQVYYFASPKIRDNRATTFNESLYSKYSDYYIQRFEKLANMAIQQRIKTFFYPSSIFIDQKPLNYKEYIKAKNFGENICKKLNTVSNTKFIYPRLPMINTDQNLSILPLDLQDSCSIMSNYIEAI